MKREIEYPLGMTKEEVEQIVSDFHKYEDEFDNGAGWVNDSDFYDEIIEGPQYIDRYFFVGNAEFRVSTDKEYDESWFGEEFMIQKDGEAENCIIVELEALLSEF